MKTFDQIIHFDSSRHEDFINELSLKVDAYFTEKGISRFATMGTKLKGVLMVILYLVPYMLFFLYEFPFPVMLSLSVISGIGLVGIGFNISHEACHNSYSQNSKVNHLLGYSFNLMGVNSYLWKIKHNISHHVYSNIYTHDEDLLESDGVRLSPNAPHKSIHRLQHIYYFMFYPLYTLIWIFSYDFQVLKRFNGSVNPLGKHPVSELVIFYLSKLLYIVLGIVIPLIYMNGKWWQILSCFILIHAVAGIIMACVVKLGHIVDTVEHFEPDENGMIQHAWAVHVLKTSSNFSMDNAFIGWFTGGLNYQIEHHLYPGTCSEHYPAIAPIIKDVSERYGLPYHCHKSMWSGLKSHYRILKRLGNPQLSIST
jgi:linoleoyl-CoA desaturase